MNVDTTLGRILTNLNVLISGLAANAADLVHLQSNTQLLTQLRDELVAMNDQQEADKARLHQASDQLNSLVKRVKSEVQKARNGVKSVYGNRSLKLEEFGVPFRINRPARKPAAAAAAPGVAPTAEPASGPQA